MPENNDETIATTWKTIKQIISDAEYCADLAEETRALVRLAGQQIEWSRRNVLRGLRPRAEKQLEHAKGNLGTAGSLSFYTNNVAQLIAAKSKRLLQEAPGS